MTQGPTVTLKLATSLDGKIATAQGESRWITGQLARQQGHILRAQHDAVVIGIGTALADNPQLTVRLSGFDGRQPARVVFDSHQRLSADANLVQTAREVPTIVISLTPLNQVLTDAGVIGIALPVDPSGHPCVREAAAQLSQLGKRLGIGLNRLYIEGGGQLAASFLTAGLVDRLEWFRAPMILGDEGRAGIGALGLVALTDAPRFRRTEISALGDDLWERYERM
jgi:diaminohydroxyphosphoribosylaminopyrimidine deaminase/5-amino-6-(5-phosphoribosylamino)uracil reductase